MKSATLIAALTGALSLANCNFLQDDGGGVETTALSGQVTYPDGRPAVGASVRLRSVDYLQDARFKVAGKRSAAASYDALTDENGWYFIRFYRSSPLPGRSYLDINDGESNGALVVSNTPPRRNETVVLERARLVPTGSIAGAVQGGQAGIAGGYVQVYGLDRVAAIRPATGAFRIEDMPAGTYALRITGFSDGPRTRDMEGVVVRPGEETRLDPMVLGWSETRTLLINTSASGADVATSLPAFPLLVRLDSRNFDFGKAQPEGRDLRFFLPDGRQMAHEISRWDSARGAAEVWVRLDSLAGNAVSSLIMAWGNADAPAGGGGKAVFDSASGARAVFHFDAGSGLVESSGNLQPGTNNGAAWVPGIAGNGFSFVNPSPNIVLFPHAAGLDAKGILENPQGSTFSWWMYPEEDLDTATNRRDIIAKGVQWDSTTDQDWSVWILGRKIVLEGWPDDGSGWAQASSAAVDWQPNTWYHVVVVYDGRQVRWHLNGAPLGAPVSFDHAFLTSNDSPPIAIGKHHPNWRDNQCFKGVLDEVGIHGVARSADWAKASYLSQRPEGGLTSFAP